MHEHDGGARASAEDVLSKRMAELLGEIGAAARERLEGRVRAARLRLAATHGAKRLRLRLDRAASSRAA